MLFVRFLLIIILLASGAHIARAQQIYYRTTPADSSWIQMGPYATRLEEADTLWIRLTDSGSNVLETGPLIFIREEHFYFTQWFISLVLMLLAFSLYLLFRYFLNKSRKNALIQAHVSELERSAFQAQMNPHFIFNSLNSIQSYIAGNENEQANRYLAKFSRLMRSMLNNSRASFISLQEEIDSLTLYLELEKMRFKEKFDFDITIDEELDPESIHIPPLLIQPYLENAIIHGLSQMRSHGRISLYYILDGPYLIVTVADNGIGIEQSKKQKQSQGSLDKSVGMSITQKRLEILDQENKDQKVKIEEIKDRLGEVLGTKVEVKIRIK